MTALHSCLILIVRNKVYESIANAISKMGQSPTSTAIGSWDRNAVVKC